MARSPLSARLQPHWRPGGSGVRPWVLLAVGVVLPLLLLPILFALRRLWSLDALVPDPTLDTGVGLGGRLVAGFSVIGGEAALDLFFAPLVSWLLLRGRRGDVAFCLGGFVGADLVDRLIKIWVAAPRPELSGEVEFGVPGLPKLSILAILGLLVVASLAPGWRRATLVGAASLALLFAFGLSLDALLPVRPGLDGFPSGHATGSMAVSAIAVALAWSTRRLRVPVMTGAAIFVFGVGLSRLYLDAHYPADVVGGWCVALMSVCLAWLIRGPLARDTIRRSVGRPLGV